MANATVRLVGPDGKQLTGQGLLEQFLGYEHEEGKRCALAYCPIHLDVGGNRSLHIDVYAKDGLGPLAAWLWCSSCGANGVDIEKALGIPGGQLLHGSFPSFAKTRKSVATLPGPSVVEERAEALVGGPLDKLSEWRDLLPSTLRRYEVGWNEKKQRYELPVRASRHGPLVNVRWCTYRYEGMDPPGLRGLSGRGTWLYPWPPKDERWVLLVEGEWDCLVAREHGLPAYAVPGAKVWQQAWASFFSGMKVVVLFDADNAGRRGAQRVAESLRLTHHNRDGGVRDVRVVDLSPKRRDGFDLSAWFQGGRTKEELVERFGQEAHIRRGPWDR